jgi:hypothetical protein
MGSPPSTATLALLSFAVIMIKGLFSTFLSCIEGSLELPSSVSCLASYDIVVDTAQSLSRTRIEFTEIVLNNSIYDNFVHFNVCYTVQRASREGQRLQESSVQSPDNIQQSKCATS